MIEDIDVGLPTGDVAEHEPGSDVEHDVDMGDETLPAQFP